jgi:hypothetical protein
MISNLWKGCFRGVASVEGNVADPMSYIAKEQAMHELRGQMMDILFPKK